jgi:hypothetical protein
MRVRRLSKLRPTIFSVVIRRWPDKRLTFLVDQPFGRYIQEAGLSARPRARAMTARVLRRRPLCANIAVLSLANQERSYHKAHDRHRDWIPQAGIDVSSRRRNCADD